jgi:hypothetical protein
MYYAQSDEPNKGHLSVGDSMFKWWFIRATYCSCIVLKLWWLYSSHGWICLVVWFIFTDILEERYASCTPQRQNHILFKSRTNVPPCGFWLTVTPPPQCHHMSIMDFVVSCPGCGRSVTDFWGWDAREVQFLVSYPDKVDGGVWIWSTRRGLKPKFY